MGSRLSFSFATIYMGCISSSQHKTVDVLKKTIVTNVRLRDYFVDFKDDEMNALCGSMKSETYSSDDQIIGKGQEA